MEISIFIASCVGQTLLHTQTTERDPDLQELNRQLDVVCAEAEESCFVPSSTRAQMTSISLECSVREKRTIRAPAPW